jgi:subtilase family protein
MTRIPSNGPARRPGPQPPARGGRRVIATPLAAAVLTATAAVTAAVPATAAWAGPARTPGPAVAAARPAGATPAMRRACPTPKPGYAQCLTLFRPQAAVNRAIAAGARGAAATPKGWSPHALRSAYKLPSKAGSTQTVAVSIAFDTPKLAQYLATYRKFYGLPPCTAASGCFRKVNQQGKPSPLPKAEVGSGWDLEATLDVSMISAACPHCKILVVEGKDPGFGNMAATENAAAKLGAEVISNSYGARESGETQVQAHAYDHPGHVITVSSGDLGFGAASFPANLATVTAVGGTQLSHSTSTRGWHEQVWNQPSIFGAGASGCSAYVAKPAWQHDPHCSGRTVADVAAVATNIPIFNADYGGWVSVAGTSASAPLIAGVYGLAGNGSQLSPGDLYQHRSKLFDITTGDNALFGSPAATCGDDYLCAAKKGYDAPTGLGTPDGTGAF